MTASFDQKTCVPDVVLDAHFGQPQAAKEHAYSPYTKMIRLCSYEEKQLNQPCGPKGRNAMIDHHRIAN